MPCYQVNMISLELGAADRALLEAALKSLGLSMDETIDGLQIKTPDGCMTLSDGKVLMEDYMQDNLQPWVNRIKRAYAMKAVELVAKKYRMTVVKPGGSRMSLRRY